MKQEMVGIAQDAVEKGRALGVQCEAFVQKSKSTSITVEGGKVSFGAQDGDYGVGIRIIKDRRVGYAFCTPETLDFGIKNAIAVSRFGKTGNYMFHGNNDYSNTKSIFDNKIASLVPEDGLRLARDIMESATYDKRANPARGGIGFGVSSMAVANSNGVAAYDEGTQIGASMMSIIKEGDVVVNGDESEISRSLDFNFEDIGHKATENAISQLEQKGIETGAMTVILRPSAAFDIITNTVLSALYGSTVKKGESMYADMIDKHVAADSFSMIDDGTFNKGLNTYAFDEEGHPSQRNELIRDGVLRMFLYDQFSALENNAKSTGNAMRAERLESGTSHKFPPTTCARNIILEGETMAEAEMIKGVKNGVLVYDVLGAHTANRASGDFSVAIYCGYAIKDGEIAYPLKGGMIGGNMPAMLKGAVLANNYKLVGSMSPASGYVPSIKFENVRVAGD